jgi:hypothetical protein
MRKKSLSVIAIISVILLSGFVLSNSVLPKVKETSPKNGAQNVDPKLTKIWVKFDKPMMDKSWSWCYDDKSKFPQMTDKPCYSENNTKCTLPVKLEPHKEYVIWINTKNFKDFKDATGVAVEPYKISFRTK